MLGDVDAGDFLQAGAQLDALPGRSEVDLLSLIANLRRTGYLDGRVAYHLLGEFHDLKIIGIGPVELKLGELRIVLERNAFVAEVAADLVDAFQVADEQPLEV